MMMDSSNVVRDVMEYSTRNACPSRIHWYCIELNSSCPAVYKMSNKHAVSSITNDFLYEYSMVGSYSYKKLLVTKRMVSADLPTPPPPNTTILYSRLSPPFDIVEVYS
eukprot:914367_1